MDFGTFDGSDSTTIADWFATGTPGGVFGLDASFGALQMSAPNINNGTATTTFIEFYDNNTGDYQAGKLTITHDDGMLVYGAGGFAGPNSQKVTELAYAGGYFDMIYVATNGDPSVLNVDLEAVPLPAGLPLMLLGIGSFAFLRRRAA